MASRIKIVSPGQSESRLVLRKVGLSILIARNFITITINDYKMFRKTSPAEIVRDLHRYRAKVNRIAMSF